MNRANHTPWKQIEFPGVDRQTMDLVREGCIHAMEKFWKITKEQGLRVEHRIFSYSTTDHKGWGYQSIWAWHPNGQMYCFDNDPMTRPLARAALPKGVELCGICINCDPERGVLVRREGLFWRKSGEPIEPWEIA